MAISLGNTTAVGASGSHNNNGDTVIYVVGCLNSSGTIPTITSATYNSVAMVAEGASNTISFGANDKGTIRIFRLDGAAAGANTAAATVSGSEGTWGYCISLIGSHQTSGPVAVDATTDDTSFTLTSENGGIIICGVRSRTNGHTPASGLTELYDNWNGTYGHGFAVGYELTTGASETSGWSSVTAAGFAVTYKQATITQSVAGTLTFTGTPRPFAISIAKTGAQTFTGTVVKAVAKTSGFTGVLTFAGTLTKQAGKIVSGAATFTGTLVRQANKVIAGALTFAGTITTGVGRVVDFILDVLIEAAGHLKVQPTNEDD